MITNLRLVLGTLLFVFMAVFLLRERSLGGEQSSSQRVVTVPVTVVDRNDHYVSALKAASFSVSEGGHNRPVESVEEVGPLLVGRSKVKVPFIVVDAVGSSDQNEARKQCLQLLANSAANGLPVSVSEIDLDGLREIHSVATSNSVLASALLKLDGESRFLDHREQLEAIINTSDDKALVMSEAARLRGFRHGSLKPARRIGIILTQLKAFQNLAAALQRAHGRKTVLWVTDYFPVDINESEDSLNIQFFPERRSEEISGIHSPIPVKPMSVDYQRTIDLLNDAQVSIFPVYANLGATSNSPGPLQSDYTRIGLRRFGRSTGGDLITSSDNLQNIVQRAEDQSSSYYLLTFRPEQIKSDLRWRALKIELQDKSLRANSPDGLFLFNLK